ncbi:hypothetical protein K461DRAFT_85683 [Myriangium duriaei CBS 260.36]|uniref:Uncharacterized protein n=1 Tax=Myriangium duriaei CBS 260.36 TaxID=1168546 RepID=A0A9P4JBT1_9PEZI|nr:hypothetical protein K461DRAFT_85683 [Myriangium duriaei CBS 260.36]
MPSLDIKRRADSVTESSLAYINRYKTKPLPRSPAPSSSNRKGSYSLYPNCTPTISKSPPTPQPTPQPTFSSRHRHEARQGIRPPVKHRSSASKMSGALPSEPFADDFHSRLTFQPTPSFDMDSLPGLDGDLPATPSFGGPELHEDKQTRTLKSAKHQ